MPLPESLSRFSGEVGSGTLSGLKPCPWSVILIINLLLTMLAEMETVLFISHLLPCHLSDATSLRDRKSVV